MFDRIRIADWRQFRRLDIQFDQRLTVVTGANGAGKTTILNLLGKHFGWEVPLLRQPFRSKREMVRDFLEEHWGETEGAGSQHTTPSGAVGWIRYTDGSRAHLIEPTDHTQVQFSLTLQGQRPVKGLHIPSHRPIPGRSNIAQLPTSPPTKASALQNYRQEVLRRHLGSHGGKSPGQLLKESIMALCLVANGGDRVTVHEGAAETLDQFESILRLLLPAEFGFDRFTVEMPELYLRTDAESIPFDAISGGIASLIDIAYQIFMYSPEGEPYVVVIDEPENHLHPALQRELLPRLLDGFPQVQFIVATHNPFVIGSHPAARVYALLYDDGKVQSRYLDVPTKSGTATEILRDVLGMQSTLPLWVDRAMEEIIERYVNRGLSPGNVRALEAELEARGLENQVTEALVKFNSIARQR